MVFLFLYFNTSEVSLTHQAIMAEGKDHALGIGITKMSTDDM